MTSGGKNNNYDHREKRTVKKMVHFCSRTSVFNLNNTKTNSRIFLLNVYILNTGCAKSMGPFTQL